jgi:hypothetical protein
MKIRFTFIILLICLCFPSMMSAQTTLYVTTTGDDGNDGSVGSPWRTIQHAINEAYPGDIIEVATGTYTETLSIAKSLTINGAAGAIVKPPAYDPNKIINGNSNPLVRIYVSERKSASPEKFAYGEVSITGIEFDCDFHPSINVGIEATIYDLVFDDIKVHSIQQTNADVSGITIDGAGSIVISNSKIYDILATLSDVTYTCASIGINIIGSQVYDFKSLHDEYDIVITGNELYDIFSEGEDTDLIILKEGSKAIQINYASNVLISGNNIYTSPLYSPIQKDNPDVPLFTGPSTGIFFVELDGNNTISANKFSNTRIAGLFVATPYIVVEDNDVNNSYIGFLGLGIPLQSEDVTKSASAIPQINIKLPVISPLKTNKTMNAGIWEFNNNHFDADETFDITGAVAIVIQNFTGVLGPAKNGQPFDVKISGNEVQSIGLGLYIINMSAGSYEVAGNIFSDNTLGLIVQNSAEAGMMLDVHDNDFIDNFFVGMSLFNMETINADISQNLFEGNFVGLSLLSEDLTTITVNNNKFINNVEYGIRIEDPLPIGLKNDSSTSLDATCNWWGTIDPTLIAAMVGGDVEVYPYLFSAITDPEDPAFMCGYQDVAMIPLSNHGLLLSILLITGFTLFAKKGYICSL